MGGFFGSPVITDNWGGDQPQQPKRPGLFRSLLGTVMPGMAPQGPVPGATPPIAAAPRPQQPLHHIEDDQQTRTSPPSMRPDPYAPLVERIGQLQKQQDTLNQPAPKPSLKQRILGGLENAVLPRAIYQQDQQRLAQKMAMEAQQRQGIEKELPEDVRALMTERMGDQRLAQQMQMERDRFGQQDKMTAQRQAEEEAQRAASEQRLAEVIRAQGERQQAQFGQQNQMETQRQAAQEAARRQSEAAQEARQGRQFAEEEKLLGMREQGQKATADEQRRADLANNMSENLDQLEDILKRRPELFGAMHGRMTQLKGLIGTGDPDVAKLNAIREYLGMASVGAHAMRNAQHVGAAADAVIAGFHNSPDATRAAVQAARSSIRTFQQDVERGQRGGAGSRQNDLGAAPPGASEGSIVRNRATGQRGRVMNGRIIPIASAE
jgi:hypothetical protein